MIMIIRIMTTGMCVRIYIARTMQDAGAVATSLNMAN